MATPQSPPEAHESAVGTLSPKAERRQRRIAEDRHQILDIAESLFVERGYRDTTLRMLAERCELSVGSVYKLFASKDELYRAVLYRHMRDELRQAREIAASDGKPMDRVLSLVSLHLDHVEQNPGWGRLVAGLFTAERILSGTDDELNESDRARLDQWIELGAGVVAEGQRDGSMRAGSPRALYRLLASLVSGFQLIELDPQLSSEEFTRAEFLASVEAFLAPVGR